MINKRMQEKLERGDAIDISQCERTTEDYYRLKEFVEDVDYCDAVKECWIWSIGRCIETGEIFASTNNYFYQNGEYECLFLR